MPDQTPSPLVIESSRLKVEIAAPGSVYRRTRFDWTSFITQVTLDGAHTFCSIEDPNPAKGSGGIGMCCEYGNEKVIGYADARPGDCFLKPGVGLLRRPDDANYRFMTDYAIEAEFPIQVFASGNSVRFEVAPLECRGYALRQTREMAVEGNVLTMTSRLENCGTHPVHTHEYCHNFLAIDWNPIGPGYLLRYPFPVAFEQNYNAFRGFLPRVLRKITPTFVLALLVRAMAGSSILQVRGNEITWKSVPSTYFFCRPIGFFQTNVPQWELIHQPSGVTVRETDDFIPARFALWGARHVVSPEVYMDIDLEPGQSQTWTRRFEFTA